MSIETCFTYFGQRIRRVSDSRCDFSFLTQPRSPPNPLLALHHHSNLQGAIFEVKAPLRSIIELKVDSKYVRFSLEEALTSERIIGFKDESERMIYEQFGLSSEDVNPDVYWHNAWKMKIFRAVPEEEYKVRVSWIDDNKDEENYYYVRVIQLNGQMAWSSPIWTRS